MNGYEEVGVDPQLASPPRVAGAVTVLSQTFRVGKRHRGLYLRLVVDTGRGHLTAYLNGRVLKRWLYQLLNDRSRSNHAAAVGCRRQ